ncbi:MAG: lipopolysaccharide biosynthesis protein [Anaerolineae bacterium]|nr:lipopolysaccharide biosynthesis protein [Anaerolineae bacterium]
MTPRSNHANKAISGSLWMLSAAGARQALTLLFVFVLARILTPDDYAAVALVSAVTVILQAISELGVSVAVIQRKKVDKRLLDSAFTLTFALFAAAAVSLLLLARPFAHYYSLPLLAPLMYIAAATFFLQGVTSFYRSLLLRDLNFRTVSVTGLLATLMYGVTATVSAWLGHGAYSIMWGHLSEALLALFIFVLVQKFRPQSLGTLRLMRELLQFGVWIALGRMLGQASGQFDRFLIGKVLTAQALGGYYLAYRITTMLPNILTGTLDQVLLPVYSGAKNDAQVIERGYWRGLRLSAILFLPLSILITAYARPLVWLTLGEKWMYIVPLVQILSIFGATQTLGGGIFASVIYASNIPQLNPLVNIFRIIVLPVCVWIGSRWGVEGVAWGLVAFGISGRFFNQWLLKRYLNYSFFQYFRETAVPIIVNMGLLVVGWLIANWIPITGMLLTGVYTGLAGLLTMSVYALLCKLALPADTAYLVAQLQQLVRSKLRNISLKR